jgi:hypothetical protein
MIRQGCMTFCWSFVPEVEQSDEWSSPLHLNLNINALCPQSLLCHLLPCQVSDVPIH